VSTAAAKWLFAIGKLVQWRGILWDVYCAGTVVFAVEIATCLRCA
jgi:hypothetical protein